MGTQSSHSIRPSSSSRNIRMPGYARVLPCIFLADSRMQSMISTGLSRRMRTISRHIIIKPVHSLTRHGLPMRLKNIPVHWNWMPILPMHISIAVFHYFELSRFEEALVEFDLAISLNRITPWPTFTGVLHWSGSTALVMR